MVTKRDALNTSISATSQLTLVLISFLVFFSPLRAAFAAQWQIVPRISLSETYDDNVRLARQGREEDDYITQINPGISVAGKGRSTELTLDYTLQNVFYKDHDAFDDTYHKLRASNKTELVRDHLFLDASASYSQRTIDPAQISSTNNIGITENRTDVVFYKVKPYFIHAFGQSSRLLLQHTYNEVDYKSDTLSSTDNKTNTSYIELKNGPAFTNTNWKMSHKMQVAEYRLSQEIESEDSQLELRYIISPKIYLIGVGGYEKYDYDALPGQGAPEGSYWETGIGWTPTQRTLLEVRHGDHYYGQTDQLTFNHRTRRSNWVVTYTEDIVTSSRIEARPEEQIFEDDAEYISYTTVPSVFLNKMLSGKVTKTTGKSEISLSLLDSRREYLDRLGDERVTNAILAWDWRFAGRTSLIIKESFSQYEISITDQKTETYTHEVRVERNISQTTSSYFSYSHITQESDQEGTLYKRNIYTVGLTASF